jgi:hypothetical protein
MIQSIVEGHGEVSAVPILIRKLGELMGLPYVPTASPIRRPRSKIVQADGLRQAIELAKIQRGCRGILVLLDTDDDCPKTIAPALQAIAQSAAQPLPCAVVLAKMEYEAWLLACIESLRGSRGISATAVYEKDPENVRAAKTALESLMISGRTYLETSDQAALTAVADWAMVHQQSRSFRKMAKEVRRLFVACGFTPNAWPQPGEKTMNRQ